MMKLKVIRVTPEFLAQLISGRQKRFKTSPRLPIDLKIVEITRHFDFQEYNYFDVICESAEFEEILEGGAIPFIDLVITEKYWRK